jgi:pimeloyl-ACP methyl ester carboxylesterase
MAILERDGSTLFYDEAGRGDPPIVFIHGWTCDHTYFSPQFDHFSRDHRVVAVDLRGHGQSATKDDYTISAFAGDVAWLCAELGLQRPVVVGHSMGSLIALEIARAHPDLPSALVMVDAAPIVVSPELRPMLAAMVESMAGPDHDAVRRGFVEGMLFIDSDDQARKARIVEQMTSAPREVAQASMNSMMTFDGEAAATACGVPALHIGAAQPINDAAALKALNPLIQTGQTVGAGHFNQLEVPDQVNAMIERFLESTLAVKPV